jgi:hypothetical protein
MESLCDCVFFVNYGQLLILKLLNIMELTIPLVLWRTHEQGRPEAASRKGSEADRRDRC